MNVSVIAFRQPDGSVRLRGLTVLTAPSDFTHALTKAFSELGVNELWIQFGKAGDPSTYALAMIEVLMSEYLKLSGTHFEMLENRLVKILDPNGKVLTRFWSRLPSDAPKPRTVKFSPDDEKFIAMLESKKPHK
jgi:hypothetical protein